MSEGASQGDHGEKGHQDKDSGQYGEVESLSCPGSDSAEEQRPPDHQSAESGSSDSTEEEDECPGCQSIGVLVLPCGHKLCSACIQMSQEELGQDGCTVCYGSQLMDSVLKTLLDALFQDQPRRPGVTPGAGQRLGDTEDVVNVRDGAGDPEREQELCVRHGELLSLFCLEEEELVCQECQRDKHDEHHCCPIEDAVLDCKKELRSAVRALQDRLDTLTSIRETWQDTAAHIKSQSEHTAQVLKEDFEKMHQFLRDEEAALMSVLKQEEEEKSQRMKEKIDRISNDIRELTDTVREVEEAMELEDFLFLKNYKSSSERAQCKVEEPEEESGALIDVAKHQGCLQHHVWDKMQNIIQYFPVILDPNTASVCLSVSTDLSSVSVCEEQSLPDNPERFVHLQSVLGSEGFSSGRHSWEVEVGDNSHWSLGVARDSIHRKDWSSSSENRSNSDQNPNSACSATADPGEGLWTVSLSSGQYHASPGQSNPLKLRRKPRRVRVQLDWERGSLTLSDANDNTLIYRFKHQWNSMLRPYLSTTCSKHPLRITAGRVTVTTE
ncbi:E3 ubiquitin-protein ligase TRIM39 [Myripristis murdjan]|uniref:E3 ubiquitin-protein ligase TRIM39 n=1 Tax=Myripristis murdjan TaxID=586833 RepID=UPI001175F411|nr:E3 ubiquitin-protein ligase TRIM39-like [Myripristis murdjan]